MEFLEHVGKKNGVGMKVEMELENLLLGCAKDMSRPQEISVRTWKDGLQKFAVFSQTG